MAPDYDTIVHSIREEISKYYDGNYSNTDSFTRDLHIASDDLSVVAISLEKKFSIKLGSQEYRDITNVESYARALQDRL